MADLQRLNGQIRELFAHAVSAVDARIATAAAVRLDGEALLLGHTRIESVDQLYVVAIGKAAPAMALGVNSVLGKRIMEGVVVGPAVDPSLDPHRWQSFIGGHPLPNQSSLNAGRWTLAMLDRANHEHALVVFLISGGGSAMFEWPANDSISLEDLRRANDLLVKCGASIREVNAVRRDFSAVKGGKLSLRANKAQIVTLIVSDTNPGDEASVASGPTLFAPADEPSALEVINRYKLTSSLPASIIATIKGSAIKAARRHDYYLLADNATAVAAAKQKASAFGFDVIVASDISEQEIAEGCELLLERLRPARPPVCLVSGGEFSCPVRGEGRGGRNLETVLRCALGAPSQSLDCHSLILSAGTDGIDGNSPAAGAVADETTLERGNALGLNAENYLERSDSYGYFDGLNDLVLTGPTGTNVRDLRVLLKAEK